DARRTGRRRLDLDLGVLRVPDRLRRGEPAHGVRVGRRPCGRAGHERPRLPPVPRAAPRASVGGRTMNRAVRGDVGAAYSWGRVGKMAVPVLRHAVLVLLSLIIFLPLFWVAMSSLKPVAEIYKLPTSLLPDNPTTQWYVFVLTKVPALPRYYANSL